MCGVLTALATVAWALLPVSGNGTGGGARAGGFIGTTVSAAGQGPAPSRNTVTRPAGPRPVLPGVPVPGAQAPETGRAGAPAAEDEVSGRSEAPNPLAKDPGDAFAARDGDREDSVASAGPSAAPPGALSPNAPAWRTSLAAASARPAPPVLSLDPGQGWRAVEIRRGDTLTGIFQREGLSQAEALRIARLDGAGLLTRIRPGEVLHLLPADSEQGRIRALAYEPESLTRLEIRRDSGSYHLRTHRFEPRVERRYASGEIRTSLFRAGNEAGLSDRLMHELVQIFGWSVDFALDVRSGDRFAVIYEQRYHDGKLVSEGPILAAEFINRGETLRAIAFSDADGHRDYYTPEGLSMRRQFLRTPVQVGRITSGFTKRRFHPILKRWRSHKGVDYGAPHGTPILATADGRVVERARKGGYGNAVVLRHGSQYSTLYGHMARFARGVRVGDRVRQGEVIGYVGATGLATGPHLHYEFRVNGTHRNPVTFEMPPAEPIAADLRPSFLEHARLWTARLDSGHTRALAQAADDGVGAGQVARSD